MKLSWFLVRRSNDGGVAEIRTGLTEEAAVVTAEVLNGGDVSPVAFLTPSKYLQRMPRWTIHWRMEQPC